MGTILAIMIILIMLLVLGVDAKLIIGIVLGMIGLAVAVMFIFFLVCGIILLGTKKCTAVFSRIGESPRGKFECAYYAVDGEEFPNAFPCEVAFRESIYRSDREVTVRLTAKRRFVFDQNAFLACVAGLFASSIMCAFGAVLAAGIIGF